MLEVWVRVFVYFLLNLGFFVIYILDGDEFQMEVEFIEVSQVGSIVVFFYVKDNMYVYF